MHHAHIDRIASLSGPLHSMDPRVKLLATLVFVLLIVLTPDGWFISFGVYAALLVVVMAASRLPVSYIAVRSLTIIPFALAVSIFVPFTTPGPVVREFPVGPFDIAVTSTGLVRFASLGLRALISFFATIMLVASTRFGDLMGAAGKLGMPSKIVEVMSFMYRYLFIIIDEAAHMMLARDLRSFRGKRLSLLTASGGIVGALFVRSFEHADRLYNAMLLRGYTGKPTALAPMHIRIADIVYSSVFVSVAAAALLVGRSIHA